MARWQKAEMKTTKTKTKTKIAWFLAPVREKAAAEKRQTLSVRPVE